jgi:diamine N-acetyltransferase
MRKKLFYMSIHFRAITRYNWSMLTGLKVNADQEKFVFSNVTILAKAFAFRNDNSRVFAIYNEDIPVGMLMQRDFIKEEKLTCLLDQFMIAEQYQGKGFGKAAMQLWLSMIKKEEKYESIILCYKEGNVTTRNLYLRLGFHHTGVVYDDEIIMEYDLKDKA